MRVVISGASGLIGTALSQSLRRDGHDAGHLVRREAGGPGESAWSPADGQIDHEVIASADVVVNLAGASIGGKRLTQRKCPDCGRYRIGKGDCSCRGRG